MVTDEAVRPGDVPRPFPATVESEYADHFAGLIAGELRVRECATCSAVQWPPRATCAGCDSTEFRGHVLPWHGEVHTFTVVRRAFHPWFADRVPYGVAVVDVADGVRMAGLFDGPVDQLSCGLRVVGRGAELSGSPALVWSPEAA